MALRSEEGYGVPSWYGATLYRSKVEAAWAMYYSLLDIAAEYEQWSFLLEPEPDDVVEFPPNTVVPYVPDFFLTATNLWIEVKWGRISDVDRFKIDALARHTRQGVLLIDGPPWSCHIYLKTFGLAAGRFLAVPTSLNAAAVAKVRQATFKKATQKQLDARRPSYKRWGPPAGL